MDSGTSNTSATSNSSISSVEEVGIQRGLIDVVGIIEPFLTVQPHYLARHRASYATSFEGLPVVLTIE